MVANDQRIGQTITASLTFSHRVALLKALFGMLKPYGIGADVDGLNVVLSQAEAAAGKRNDVVHALLWHQDQNGELAHSKLKPKKAAEWVQAPGSVEELSNVAEKLKEAREAVSQFTIKHFEPYGPDAWASPYGDGTLYGPNVRAAIMWNSQSGQRGA